jgi:HPt (histidine-containing phosphotransfer) domain-containing protein
MMDRKEQPPLIDIDFLESRKEITDSFLHDLIELFNEEMPKVIDNIKAQYKANKVEEVKTLGHKLKGMSLNLGAIFLSQQGEKIETDDFESVAPCIDSLDEIYEKTRQALAEQIPE